MVQAGCGVAGDRRSLRDGAARSGARDPVSRCGARCADALRDVSSFGGQTGTIEAGSQRYRWTGDSRVETWREPMIRSDNLRSAFRQEEVDKYSYDLLPERDAAVKEMEAYAAEHSVPIIGPARGGRQMQLEQLWMTRTAT